MSTYAQIDAKRLISNGGGDINIPPNLSEKGTVGMGVLK